MLQEIRIRDLGIIDDATLDLAPGLNVLTGETGAGKTMVVQGLGLLLGRRASAAQVRSGQGKAVVEGVFDVDAEHPAARRARDAGADVDDVLLVSRSVSDGGRSRAWVGGRNAPVGVLCDLGEMLVAVHGQADQWRLQRPEQHREVLDDFGGPDLQEAKAAYQAVHRQWREAERELRDLVENARRRARRIDELTVSLEEIEAVDPQAGEDEDLAQESRRLEHLDDLMGAAGGAHTALSGTDDDGAGALAALGVATQALARVSDVDPTLHDLHLRLQELLVQVTDVAADLTSYADGLDADPERVAHVQERRAAITALLRKYGDTVEEVLRWSGDAAAELSTLEAGDDRAEQLRAEVDDLTARTDAAAQELSARRRDAAEAFGAAVTEELKHLAMGSAVVTVEVHTDPQSRGEHGADTVEIQLAANKGARPQSVAKAASGGELSRVMLAIEVVTASGDVPTFVFDEVDAGVGGAAALDIGSRLKRLSEHAQVIVVTHLAQVAAHADRHLVVSKQDDGQVTVSGVTTVTGGKRREELARMLGGVKDGAAALAHADELLELVGVDA